MTTPFIARRETPARVRLPSRVGDSDGPTRGAAAGPHWRRTGQGLYVPSDLACAGEQRVVESAMPAPSRARLTGWAALLLDGAAYFAGHDLPIDVLVPRHSNPRPRTGVHWHRRQSLPTAHAAAGVRVVDPPQALLDEAARLVSGGQHRDAVVAVDMTLLAGLCTIDEVADALRARRGSRLRGDLERVLALADGASESPPETYLRMIWLLDCGLPPPLVNTWVCDEAGHRLVVPDLLEPASGLVVEYDGGMHAELERRTRDAEKDEIYRDLGLECVRLTAIDMRSRARVVQRLRRAYARAERWVRPRRWSIGPPLRGASRRSGASMT